MRRSLAAPPQAPVYFDNIPGGFHSFAERISFPALSYNDYTSTFPGKVDIDMFFTMNANEKRWQQVTDARVDSSLQLQQLRALDGLDVLRARKLHGNGKLHVEVVEHGLHTLGAAEVQAPDDGTADCHEVRAAC